MVSPSDYGLITDLGNEADDWRGGWVAELSDGTEIFQHDTDTSSWIRLKSYLSDANLIIRNLQLRFRTNHKQIGPPYASGYFYCRGCLTLFGSNTTFHQAVIGYQLERDNVQITKYRFPELTVDETLVRDVAECGESLWQRNEQLNQSTILNMGEDLSPLVNT